MFLSNPITVIDNKERTGLERQDYKTFTLIKDFPVLSGGDFFLTTGTTPTIS